jgi:hypothetical protein
MVSFMYGRKRQEGILLGMAVVVAGLFLGLEVILWANAKLALASGQIVEVTVNQPKVYARLRDKTKQTLEMTVKARQELLREQTQGTDVVVDTLTQQEQQSYIAQNGQVLVKIQEWLALVQQQYHLVPEGTIAKK